jgi:hypothetical protein
MRSATAPLTGGDGIGEAGSGWGPEFFADERPVVAVGDSVGDDECSGAVGEVECGVFIGESGAAVTSSVQVSRPPVARVA